MNGETTFQARLTALLQANQAIASSLDLENVLHAIAREAASIADTHFVRLFLLDDDGQVLRCRVAVGLPLEAEQELMVPVGESFSGQVAATGEPLAVADCRGDPRLRHPQHAAQHGLVSYLGIPVKAHDRLFGVLVFNSPSPRDYADEEVAYLSTFAQQAGLAIHNARLHEVTQQRAHRLAILTELTSTLTKVLDPSALAQAILRAAQILTPGAVGRLWEEVSEGSALRLAGSLGLREPEGGTRERSLLGEGLTGIVAATRQPVISRDVGQDPRFIDKDWAAAEGLVSCMVLPLVLGEHVHGVLAIYTRAPHAFTEEEVDLFKSFATQAAVAIANARLHDAVQRELAERKKGEETLRALYQASLQIQEPLELRERLNRLLDTARNILHLDRLNVLLADPKGEWLQLVASLGTGEAVDAIRVPIGPEGGGIALAYLTPQTITWDGHAPVPEDLRLRPPYDQIEALRSRVFSIVPLVVQGRTIGVLGVDRKHSRRPLDALTVELLHLFAAQAALALENARLYAVTEQAAREARSLYEVAHSLTTSLDPAEVLHLISAKTTELLGTRHAQVVLWDEASGTLRLGAAYGTEAEQVKDQQFRLGEGLNGIVAQTRAPLVVNDYQTFPHRVPGLTEIVADIGVPLLYRGRFLGVLNSHATKPGWMFTDEHLALLTSFADQAAVAIENARLYAAAERGAHEARSLYEVAHSLTTSLEPGEVLDLIAVKTTELLGTPHAQVVLWDETSQTLRFGAAHGTEANKARRQQYRLGEGLNGIVAQTRAPLVVNDYQAFARRVPGLTELTADIGVPLLYRGRFLGVLNSHATQPGWRFTEEHLALLTSFADQAAVAIENARLYDAVQRDAAELEDRVRQRTAEMEEALGVKALFLANMSHELRTPLNFVIGFSELLRDGTAGPLTPKQGSYLDRIHTGGKRLLELVTHLLEMAETDSQPASFQLDRLVLNEVLDEVLAPLTATAQAKSVALETALHPGLPVVVADCRKFSQILHHLVTNAIRFTPTGGRVTVSARRVSTSKGEEAELTVQDTGIGIRPEDLERIFRPFEQADGSDTRRYGGAGLGLALARRLTELHGGRVWAESEGEGRGARFIVRLPLLPAPPPPQILVVEDEVFVREALRAALMADGYGVDGVCSGIEAQERLAAGLPNLLVLDIGLPDMDGRDLLKQLRAEARTRDLPILVLTGLGSIQPDQVLALGADEFLTKPVSPQVLSATVARLLRRPARESRGEGTGMSATAQDSTGSRT